mmetsp:Transcript_35647/g.111513  ORF Transcript_35647/g.111513 Transcript_35647/m.111513 type:complete len:274 (+) Transcript_35647:2054-2875(+)
MLDDRGRSERRSRPQGGEHRGGDGDHRDGRVQGGGKDGAGGRQLRYDCEGGEGGKESVGQPCQDPALQHACQLCPGTLRVLRLRAAARDCPADRHPSALCQHDHFSHHGADARHGAGGGLHHGATAAQEGEEAVWKDGSMALPLRLRLHRDLRAGELRHRDEEARGDRGGQEGRRGADDDEGQEGEGCGVQHAGVRRDRLRDQLPVPEVDKYQDGDHHREQMVLDLDPDHRRPPGLPHLHPRREQLLLQRGHRRHRLASHLGHDDRHLPLRGA